MGSGEGGDQVVKTSATAPCGLVSFLSVEALYSIAVPVELGGLGRSSESAPASWCTKLEPLEVQVDSRRALVTIPRAK